MAIGCTHGHLIENTVAAGVLEFARRFNPCIRFHLGDIVDTAAFRSGASGTRDEAEPILPDRNAALDFLARYEPTHVAWGNHDWRLWELQNHPKAIVAHCAGELKTQLENAVRGAQTRPYDIDDGWFDLGGYLWGHGYWYNESAIRDTAEWAGKPIVTAHIHRAESAQGRTRNNQP
jgi:hypothetical protein